MSIYEVLSLNLQIVTVIIALYQLIYQLKG